MNEPTFQERQSPRRRVLLAGISILASLVCSPSFAQVPNWRQFRRDDLGFIIDFPAAPTVTDEPEKDQDSDLIRSFHATFKFIDMEYDVGCEEYRKDINAQEIWDHVAGVYTYHLPGVRLASVVDLPGKFPTRHYIGEPDAASRGQTAFMSSRNIVTERKWIACVVIAERPIETDGVARRFFDSFSLL